MKGIHRILIQGFILFCFFFFLHEAHAQSYSVQWHDFLRADTTGTTLNKTSSYYWDAGASSKNALFGGDDGWVQYIAASTGTDRVFGLTEHPNSSVLSTTIDNGLYLQANGTLQSTELATATTLGSFVNGDTLKIERIADSVYYSKNGTVLRTVAVDSNKVLVVDASLKTLTSKLEDVTCSFNKEILQVDFDIVNNSSGINNQGDVSVSVAGATSPYTYAWSVANETGTSLDNQPVGIYSLTVTDNNSYSVVTSVGIGYDVNWRKLSRAKVSGDTLARDYPYQGWSVGASSHNKLNAGQDGWVEYEVDNAEENKMFGLFPTGPVLLHDYKQLLYGFYLAASGELRVYESGTSVIIGGYKAGDDLRIQRVGTTLYYKKNGITLRTITVNDQEEMVVGATMYTLASTFSKMRCSFDKGILPQVAVTVEADDDGSNGAVDLSIAGGTAPFTYSWSSAGATTQDVTSLTSGTYTVTITGTGSSAEISTIGVGYHVDWNGLYGMELSGETITKTFNNGWSGGVAAANILPANTDGWVELTMGADQVTMNFGFSNSRISDWAQIVNEVDYGILFGSGDIRVRENGAWKSPIISYAQEDIIRVERVGSTMYYKSNGVIFHQYPVDASEELYAYAQINQKDASFNQMRCSFNHKFHPAPFVENNAFNTNGNGSIDIAAVGGYTPFTYQWEPGNEQTEDINNLDIGTYTVTITNDEGYATILPIGVGYGIRWDTLYKADTLIDADTLVSTYTGNPFQPSGVSENRLFGGNDGWVEYTVASVGSKRFGFRSPTFTNIIDANDYDYVFGMVSDSRIYAMESGTTTYFGNCALGDVLRIERKGTNMHYSKNGEILRTVVVDNSEEYAAAFIWAGANTKFERLRCSFHSDFQDISGTFTIGGTNPDFASAAEATGLLSNKNLVGNIIYKFRDGVYSDSIEVNSNTNYTADSAHFAILFTTENTDTSATTLEGQSDIVSIDGGSNFYFNNLILKAGVGKNAVRLENASNIHFYQTVFTNDGLGDTALVSNLTDSLVMMASSISNYENGIIHQGVEKLFYLEDNEIVVEDAAVSVENVENVSIRLNIIKNATGSGDDLITLKNVSGSNEVAGNQLSAHEKTAIYVHTAQGNLDISGNSIVDTNGTAIALYSFADTLSISNNIAYTNNGSGLLLNDTISNDTLTDSLKVLTIQANHFTATNIGMQVGQLDSVDAIISNNAIDSANVGLVLHQFSADPASADSLRVYGNLVIADSLALHLDSCKLYGDFLSNTFVTTSDVAAKTFVYTESENNNFCANLMVNLSANDVVYFTGTAPTNLSTSWNNWYSPNTSTVSNNQTLILSSSDTRSDPKFKGIEFGINEEYCFSLSYLSPLLDKAVGCRTEATGNDLYDTFRYSTMDIGAIESETNAWDSLQIKLILDDSASFTAGGTGSNTDFEISGLSNYSTVDVKVYGPGSPTDELLYQSSSTSTYWDGTNTNTSQLVPEGGYRYEITLDNKTIGGLIYVKR